MENLAGRVLRGSVWISASRAIINVLGVVSTIVMARLLVPADFGLVAIGTTMLAILAAVTNLSLSQALVHQVAPTPEHFGTAWTLNAARGLVIGGIFAASGPLAASFYQDHRLAAVMYWLGFSVFLSGLTNPRRIMLQKELVFWQDFVLNVSQKVVALSASLLVAYLYRSYWALVAGIVAAQFTNIAVSYTVLPYRPRLTLKHSRELWSFSLWLTLSQAINTVNWRFDQLLIGKFLSKDALGYYTVGDNLSSLPSREATLPLTQTLFPAFAALRDDRTRLISAYQRAQAMVTAVALPVGVGVALLARPLILVLMGEKWLPASFVIEVLASVFALQTLGTAAQPLAMSQGATRVLFVRDCQLFAVRVPIIGLGMVLGGLYGVLMARVVTGVIAIGFNLFLVRRLIGLGIRSQLSANVRAITAVLGMVLAVKSIGPIVEQAPWLYIVAGGLVGACTYLLLTMALWAIARRPSGPETELLRLGRRLLRK